MANILIIDDDVTFGIMLQTLLEKNNYKVTTAFSPLEAKRMIQKHFFQVVMTDLRMPDMSGMELIRFVKQQSPSTQIVMMTGYADIATAIESIKQGAFHYIPKPLNPEEVLSVVAEAMKGQEQKTADSALEKRLDVADYQEGVSELAKKLDKHIELVAPTPMSVLIIGESGTGKEYVAKLIHDKSKRADKPFIAVDCGAIPKELVASEFFGHVKGSFTGAIADKIGHFKAASGGTLFLDEVGNLSYNTQVQLLRVLQERLVRPVGSNEAIPVDVRIIAATNENLMIAQEKGEFREDLYHRLNEFQIDVPPLRERQQDILFFAHYFLEQANHYLSKAVEGFDKAVERVLQTYAWPGNLREMKNIVKRATLLAHGRAITLKEIPSELYASRENNCFALYNEKEEGEVIRKALEAANYNKSQAARLLQIDRKTLYNKLKTYGIEVPGRHKS